MGLGALEKVDRQMRIEWQLIEGIERAHDFVMPQAREVLIYSARRERHDPALGGSGKIGLKIAHLDHDDILGVKRRAGGLVLLGAAKLRTRCLLYTSRCV